MTNLINKKNNKKMKKVTSKLGIEIINNVQNKKIKNNDNIKNNATRNRLKISKLRMSSLKTIHREDKPIIRKQESVFVCIVIPTFNESINIRKLLDILYGEKYKKEYNDKNIDLHVLVVDDNSPDGTANVVKNYQLTNHSIHLFERQEKNGLGAAYVAGITHAIKILNPDIIFEMDGDLSHDPMYVIPMIEEIRQGADFVIGSRYVKGGSIPEDWGIKRVMLSKLANVYTKSMLGIRNIHDCTGGFRAMRVSAIKRIDLQNINTKGYAFQISLLQQVRKNRLIITEVPIHFKDRVNGESKMSLKDILGVGAFVFKSSMKNVFSLNQEIPKEVRGYGNLSKNSQNNLIVEEEKIAINVK